VINGTRLKARCKSPYRLTPAETTAVEENIRSCCKKASVSQAQTRTAQSFVEARSNQETTHVHRRDAKRADDPNQDTNPRQDMLFDRLHRACVQHTASASGFRQIRIKWGGIQDSLPDSPLANITSKCCQPDFATVRRSKQ
jgi:hypothetical protein